MTIKTVIFDLDGTLANFVLNYKSLRADVRSMLLREKVPPSIITVNEPIFEMLKKVEIFFKNSNKNPELFEAVKKEAWSIAEKYEMEAAANTNLMTGAIETLKALKQMKLKICLCTISSGKSANHILQRFKIAEFFGAVVPREDAKYVKPNPEQLELTLKKLKASAKSTLIVGDSVTDMQSAKEINAVAVGFPSGISTTEQLMDSGANYIITALTDLPELVEKINKN